MRNGTQFENNNFYKINLRLLKSDIVIILQKNEHQFIFREKWRNNSDNILHRFYETGIYGQIKQLGLTFVG